MPITLDNLVSQIKPENTVLLFGAGSSLPSKAPSVQDIKASLTKKFGVPATDLSLAEFTELLQKKTGDRRSMIDTVCELFSSLFPTQGLLNVPLYNWKSIFTTNYDELLERAYDTRSVRLKVYASNYDFEVAGIPNIQKLFKLHGTVGQDTSKGHRAGMIITSSDYKNFSEYREKLFLRMKADISEANLIIIGHSLSDPDIKAVLDQVISWNERDHINSRIFFLMYTPNEDRAYLLEQAEGIKVAFGGIDDFFASLAKTNSTVVHHSMGNVLDVSPQLIPITVDVSHEIEYGKPNIAAMFNGWPATFSDVNGGLTFNRSVADSIVQDISSDKLCSILLGASGVGKSTAARQAILKLSKQNFFCWEHANDQPLDVASWLTVAERLKSESKKAVLLIDDAHFYIQQIGTLLEQLVLADNDSLRLILVSSRNNWGPRTKSPVIYRRGKEHILSKLDGSEIDALLSLVDTHPDVKKLVEKSFSGFSRYERRKRLSDRCESDMFVCLKNIFASETFDDIILREYAELNDNARSVYKLIAALEAAGVRVHRQLVVRLFSISATQVPKVLADLEDIITEETVDSKEGIYAWRGRHRVITAIIAKYKYSELDQLIDLYENVIQNVSPTYDIELRSIRELCDTEGGYSKNT